MNLSRTYIYVIIKTLFLSDYINLSNSEMSVTTVAFEKQTSPFLRDNTDIEMVPLKLVPDNSVFVPWYDLGDLGLRVRPNGADSGQYPEKRPIIQRDDELKTPDCNKIPRGGGIIKWKNFIFYQGSVLWNWTGASVIRCWVVLFVSIIMEIQATTWIKVASDNSDLRQMSSAISLYVGSLFGFAVALKKIEVSIAYAVWSALGTAVVSLAGIFMFGESCDYKKVISLGMIMLGVVGLNLQDDGH